MLVIRSPNFQLVPFNLHRFGQQRRASPVTLVCCAFAVPTSCFYDYQACRRTINRERMQQRSELRRLFKACRNSAGSRALMSMMRELGYQSGRFKVRNLMKEAELASKQPGTHRYKVARSERPDIPNLLARKFDVQQPNQEWCGDITYVWAGSRWHYLAAVLACTPGESWGGRCLINLMQNWQSKYWR